MIVADVSKLLILIICVVSLLHVILTISKNYGNCYGALGNLLTLEELTTEHPKKYFKP